MEDYNLIYYHKETGKKYLAKRVTKLDYIILDPATYAKLPLSAWAIYQNFTADKDNHKRQKKACLNFRREARE